jgi:hypothetical protein
LIGKETRIKRVVAANGDHQVREHGAIRRQEGSAEARAWLTNSTS